MTQTTVQDKTKDLFSNVSTLVTEYIDKHKDEKEFFFLQFNPNPTISAYELLQVMMLNNTLLGIYGIAVTPINPIFVSAEMYYGMLSPELIQRHFQFLGSDRMSLTEAYDRINNSVN